MTDKEINRLPPTTAEGNAWLSNAAYNKALDDAEKAKQDGYIEVPDWFPVPTEGYDYKFFGQMLVYMKPKPKLSHVLRYKYKSFWLTWRQNRRMRKLCDRINRKDPRHND